MNRDDYQHKRALVENWKAQTDPLDLAAQVETVQRVGKVHTIHCPFHADDKPSMVIYPDGYKCFGCGWAGSVSDFVMAINGWNFTQLVDYVASFELDTRPLNIPKRQNIQPERTPLNSGLVSRFSSNMTAQHYSYWQSQGIPRAVLDKFQIGHTGERWAFPWHYRGALMAYKLRRDDRTHPDLEPKYISLKGSHYDAPYNIDSVILGDVPPVVILNEDEKSAIASACYGLVGISSPAGKWTSEWSALIQHVPQVIIIQNTDEPGRVAALERQRLIGRRARIVCFGDYKDLFDLHNAVWDIPGSRELMIHEWLGL